jgi:hypothetical protein
MGFMNWVKRAPENEQGHRPGWQTLKVYLYGRDGRYGSPNWAETSQEFVDMVPKIREHVDNKLEVRITNGDDHLLFHATEKGIEWDGIKLTPMLDKDRRRKALDGLKNIFKARRGQDR